jgi:riboflavin kinase/FMN adenylyltransferase
VKLLRDLAELPETIRGGAVTIGNFDGVHRGHARIVERLLTKAREVGGEGIVLTFDPHPALLLRPDQAPPPLTWTERKAELLTALGVDATIAYPTDEELLKRTPEQFFRQIVIESLGAKAMVEGANFYFGRGRSGNVATLRELCAAGEIPLEVVEPVIIDGEPVSSSRVRKLIADGQIEEGNHLLTQPYRIRGMVRHGAARGSRIGYPTANLEAVDTLLPAPGVYAGRSRVHGSNWPAAINIGPNPTFGEHSIKVEVHLVGFHDWVYGEALEVDLLARLRDIVRFDSVDDLRAQLARDSQIALETFERFLGADKAT